MPALGLVRARSVHLRAEVADPRGAAELCGAADNARVRSFRGGLNAHNKKRNILLYENFHFLFNCDAHRIYEFQIFFWQLKLSIFFFTVNKRISKLSFITNGFFNQ